VNLPWFGWKKPSRTLVKNLCAHAVRLSSPTERDNTFDLATECIKAGRLTQAEKHYKQILSLQPLQTTALHNLGLLYVIKGNKATALEFLHKAIELQPDDPHLLTGLGLVLESQEKFISAIEILQKALVLKSDYNPAYKALVRCLAVESENSDILPSDVKITPNKKQHRISVIICSIDHDKERNVVANYRTLLADTDYELIIINDAKSLCEGYNRGIAKSTGDILIFSHDDIEIVSLDFAEKLFDYLNRYDVIAVAGTDRLIAPFWGAAGWPHVHGVVIHRRPNSIYDVFAFGFDPVVRENIQAVDGLFFAVNRRVVEAITFDETRFDGFHFYDIDFSFAAYLAGFNSAVCSDILMIHDSAARLDDNWQRYASIFEEKYKTRFMPPPATLENDVVNAKLSSQSQAIAFCRRLVAVGNHLTEQRCLQSAQI